MELVGRNYEVTILEDVLISPKAELIAVYGRRRVGKTFLIKEVYKKNMAFYMSGIYKGSLQEHMNRFDKALVEYGYKGAKSIDWFKAFDNLQNLITTNKKKTKKVIFIDEMPWLSTHKSRFLQAFSSFWNSWASTRNDLVVVICGSSASWMINKIIRDKGGLHNRITQRLRLEPFNLMETELFLRKRNIVWERLEVLKIYMVLGGIPYYLDQIKLGESGVQALDRLCFAKNGSLRIEYSLLFESLFQHSQTHIKTIEALAAKPSGLTRYEIMKKTKSTTGGGLTQILQELEESGFITQYTPFGKKTKDNKIKLTDSYTLFYHKYISTSGTGAFKSWEKIEASPSWASWSGLAFENVCLLHIHQVRKALKIDGIYSNASSWYHTGTAEMQGAQVDLLLDRADGIINLCEIKFSEQKFTFSKKYADQLKMKVASFKFFTKTKRTIFPTLISSGGLNANINSIGLVQNVVTINDLFSAGELSLY